MSEQPVDTTNGDPLDKQVAKAQGRLVRSYSADGTLHAYRDGDEHVVVSAGNKPQTRWTERVSAEDTNMWIGKKRWTVPDNWTKIVHKRGDTIDYGIYARDDTDKLVKLSIPTNDHLVDAWYGVCSIGTDLTAEVDGTLGTATDVRDLATDMEAGDTDYHDTPKALRRVADNWCTVEADLEQAEHWAADEGIVQQRTMGQPLPTYKGEIEFGQPIFRPSEVIKREVDLSDLDTEPEYVVEALRSDDLLPSRYTFHLSLE